MNFIKIGSLVFFTIALGSLSGCFVQTNNSVNGDAKAFQPLPASSSAAFSQVRSILQKNCASCHAQFAGYSEADFVANKLVEPKQPDASAIILNLKGSGVGNGEMPKDSAPLSAGDIQAFRAWITNMGNVAPTAPASPFAQAQIVINNSCVGCHKEISGIKEADFVTNGWVVPGNAEASKLYYKLIGADVSGEAAGDMPLKGGALSADDLKSLNQWIDQMVPANFPAPIIAANTAFGKVQKIISDNCVKCHKDFGTNSESDFVTKGLVQAGSAPDSTLYSELIGSLPVSTDSDMPKAGAPLTTEQLESVADWINAMPASVAPPSTPPSTPPATPPGMTPSQPSGPSATDSAIGQIRASFVQNVKPLIQRGCMDCHNSKAVPDGWLGKVPGARELEKKHIIEASRIIDFSQDYPHWSAQSVDPAFYLNEIQTALTNGSMPPNDYKIFHEHDGGLLKPAETTTILNWVSQSQALLKSSDTSKPTASKFFSQKCLGCHNSDNPSGGLAFQNNAGVISGPSGTTQSGVPFITAMDPQNSAVYLVLLTDPSLRKGLAQMPFKATAAMLASDGDRQLISDWINAKN